MTNAPGEQNAMFRDFEEEQTATQKLGDYLATGEFDISGDEVVPYWKQRQLEQQFQEAIETFVEGPRRSRAVALTKRPKSSVALHNSRAKQHGARGTLTGFQWGQLCTAFNSSCAYCGCDLPCPIIEHVIPICQGGPTTLENVLPACHWCNASKSGRDLLQWLPYIKDFWPQFIKRYQAAYRCMYG